MAHAFPDAPGRRRRLIDRLPARWRPGAGAARPPVLHRYFGNGRRRSGPLLYLLLVAVTFGYGFAFALFGRYYMVPLLGPLAVLALITLWVLPQTNRAPTRTLQGAFLALFVAHLCWPDYLAIALPFLPWITLLRLTGAVLLLVLLVCLSVSPRFRGELGAVLAANRSVVVLLAIFTATGLLTLPLSNEPGTSASKFISAQVAWTAVFVSGCWVLAQRGNAARFAYGVWAVTLFVCAIGLVEWRMKEVPWRNHIPAILQVGDESVAQILQGLERAYTGVYRVQSKFGHSISLAEFLSLATPFIIHIMMTARQIWVRIAAGVTLPLVLFVDLLTDSRSAMVGLLIAVALYGLMWGVIRWRRDRESVIAAAIVYGAPALALVGGVVIMTIPRIRKIFFGGGQYQSSTDVRSVQYHNGIEKILADPFGHGVGRGGVELAYYLPDGRLTIDSYYLAVGLEYGVIGFAAFFSMFLIAFWNGMKTAVANRDRETAWILPAAIALMSFVVIKGVYAREENHPFVFMLLALVAALHWRHQAAMAAPAVDPVTVRPMMRTGVVRKT